MTAFSFEHGNFQFFNDLFSLPHRRVDLFPKNKNSWNYNTQYRRCRLFLPIPIVLIIGPITSMADVSVQIYYLPIHPSCPSFHSIHRFILTHTHTHTYTHTYTHTHTHVFMSTKDDDGGRSVLVMMLIVMMMNSDRVPQGQKQNSLILYLRAVSIILALQLHCLLTVYVQFYLMQSGILCPKSST